MSTAEQYELNKNLAQMLKGGVIMDVTCKTDSYSISGIPAGEYYSGQCQEFSAV